MKKNKNDFGKSQVVQGAASQPAVPRNPLPAAETVAARRMMVPNRFGRLVDLEECREAARIENATPDHMFRSEAYCTRCDSRHLFAPEGSTCRRCSYDRFERRPYGAQVDLAGAPTDTPKKSGAPPYEAGSANNPQQGQQSAACLDCG